MSATDNSSAPSPRPPVSLAEVGQYSCGLTLVFVLWVFVYVGLPLLVVSSVIDLLIQQITGNCTGFWCWF